MCDLLGLSFGAESTCGYHLKLLRTKNGKYNPDGWGVAYYSDSSLHLIKEGANVNESKLIHSIENSKEIKSKIFLCHLRKSSSMPIAKKNSHPFSRELYGKEYAFMHNGIINDEIKEEMGMFRFKPMGDTDSEKAFCYILDKIEKLNGICEKKFNYLEKILIYLNKLGKFNCILSDGEYLLCYADAEGNNKMKYMELGNGYAIATSGRGNLTGGKWADFENGKMKVFKEGKIIY